MIRRAPLAVVLAAVPCLRTQTNDASALWLAWLGQGRLAAPDHDLGRLRWWLDAQLRWLDVGPGHETTYLMRPGLGWMLDDHTSVWAGAMWVQTDPVGAAPYTEYRTWQQLSWTLPVDGPTLQSRTRLEQRFFEGKSETGWRLRQLVKAMAPLTGDDRWFVSLWDELFFDLDDTSWGQRSGLRQNRAFAGLGWRLTPAHNWWFEVGYLNQWIDKTTTDSLNHVASVNLFMNF